MEQSAEILKTVSFCLYGKAATPYQGAVAFLFRHIFSEAYKENLNRQAFDIAISILWDRLFIFSCYGRNLTLHYCRDPPTPIRFQKKSDWRNRMCSILRAILL